VSIQNDFILALRAAQSAQTHSASPIAPTAQAKAPALATSRKRRSSGNVLGYLRLRSKTLRRARRGGRPYAGGLRAARRGRRAR
jgi:hypothetical protein